MNSYIFLTCFVLFYSNFVRFMELRHNTTMHTQKEYWINMAGLGYSINIIVVAIILGIIGCKTGILL